MAKPRAAAGEGARTCAPGLVGHYRKGRAPSTVCAVRATMMLCDNVQVIGGKLYILGGGWDMVGPAATPMGVALKIDVDWNEIGIDHHGELFLVDEDGQPAILEAAEGPQAVEVAFDFRVERPPGIREGSSLTVLIPVNFPPLPLEPSTRYTWRLTIDGNTQPDWILGFSSRALEG